MRKKSSWWIFTFILLAATGSSCDKFPQVFSVNGFRRLLSDSDATASVKLFPVKNITGEWIGFEHLIGISSDTSVTFLIPDSIDLRRNVSFIVELMDTVPYSKESKPDTTVYRLLFITIEGQPFIEIGNVLESNSKHSFMLPVKTYLKINKLTRDTIIVQMPQSDAMAKWLKTNRYNYFVPTRYSYEDVYPVYITEDPIKLGNLLYKTTKESSIYQTPDTIIRKR
ncbi:MAG TPA: hypothetical protein VFN30_10585 [Chitinophagaceae bacterium]|nr:hypothetical protein [Chitinophagaceae bacterium]